MLKIITNKDDDKRWDCHLYKDGGGLQYAERDGKERQGTTSLHCTEFFWPINSIKLKTCSRGKAREE